MAAPFALVPGPVNVGVLDWTDNSNVKLYKTIIAFLYSDSDKYYDVSSNQFPDFLNLFSYRADDYV